MCVGLFWFHEKPFRIAQANKIRQDLFIFDRNLQHLTVLRVIMIMNQSSQKPKNGSNLPVSVKEYSESEKGRLWDHALHEDNLLTNRLNIFFGSETALLATTVAILTINIKADNLYLLFMPLCGLVYTICWLLVLLRHLAFLKYLSRRVAVHCREFKDSRDGFREQADKYKTFTGTSLIIWIFPLILMLTWAIILIICLKGRP
jgi:hypothetical protein